MAVGQDFVKEGETEERNFHDRHRRVAIFQTADYLYVRVAYYRHHPQYRNREVATLLCLS